MSFGEKRVWQQKDTWRGIAYGRYRDSREWRSLLELNQSYDIRYQPASGTVINLTGETSQGKTTSGSSNVQNGTLTQVGTNLDLRFTAATPTNLKSQEGSIFPWDSAVEYADRLGQYPAMALLSSDRTNGFSLDSPQATSDTQRG